MGAGRVTGTGAVLAIYVNSCSIDMKFEYVGFGPVPLQGCTVERREYAFLVWMNNR